MLKQLTYEEAEALIDAGEVVIADVRDIDSYEEAHIANAVHLSLPRLQEFSETMDKDKPILLYCFHGISSQSVGQHLLELGFTKVYSLIGGFEAWKAEHPSSTDS
jgi:thiosulfate sulfurtransferase